MSYKNNEHRFGSKCLMFVVMIFTMVFFNSSVMANGNLQRPCGTSAESIRACLAKDFGCRTASKHCIMNALAPALLVNNATAAASSSFGLLTRVSAAASSSGSLVTAVSSAASSAP